MVRPSFPGLFAYFMINKIELSSEFIYPYKFAPIRFPFPKFTPDFPISIEFHLTPRSLVKDN